MKIFLSAIEQGAQSKSMKAFLSGGEHGAAQEGLRLMLKKNGKPIEMLYNLMSFYYLRSDERFAEIVRDSSKEILIDSGAHSFQKGKHVDWVRYTHQYASFIKRFDKPNVLGYFEMDVDNILGYDKVLLLRKILETEGLAEKIIPVWHKNRGIEDFKEMCRSHKGRIVAVTGFRNEDIKDEQYLMFVKYAHTSGCKIHCLGMTRKAILDKVPFDYVDSSSWVQQAIHGNIGNKRVTKEFSRESRGKVFFESYLNAMKMQKHYFLKWRKENKEKEL